MKTKAHKSLVSILCIIALISSSLITYSQEQAISSTFSAFKIGDVLEFGALNDQPILWRVIDVDASGNPMIFSEKIINLMPFDIGGEHLNMDPNGFRAFTGTHFWQESFIRTWLNSTEDNMSISDFGYIEFPTTTEENKGESDYPTFFTMFDIDTAEQAMIMETTRKTAVSDFDLAFKVGGNGIDLTYRPLLPQDAFKNYGFFNYTKNDEKVFLLDTVELLNLVISRKDVLGQAFANASVLEGLENTERHAGANTERINNITGYWLRSPQNVSCDRVYTYNTDYSGVFANLSTGGVRPAMILDKNMLYVTAGEGNSISPYVLIPNENGIKSDVNSVNISDVEVGQYVNIGMYENQKILWRIIDIDAEGSPLVITDKILDILAYDASGNAYANEDPLSNRMIKGSNLWLNSTLRQWLNSSDDKVSWIGNPPSVKNVSEPLIAYSDKPGFLSNEHFTSEETNLIKPFVQNTALSKFDGSLSLSTYYNPYYSIRDIKIGALPDNDGYYHRVSDKVFLLSLRNILESIMKYKEVLGLDYFVGKVPDYVAKKMDRHYIVENQYYYNFTRTPKLGYGELIQSLDINPMHADSTVVIAEAVSAGGVRPAMYLDLKKMKQVTGEGTLENPYQFAPMLQNEPVSQDVDGIDAVIARYFDEKGYDKPSEWAKKTVFGAIATDIVPDSLQKNYINPITRAEFCQMVIQMIEQVTGTTVSESMIASGINLESYKFEDSKDLTMRQAYALGIITGFDGKAFPNATLKRSEAAVILMNTCKYLEITPDSSQSRVFTDTSKMPEWCKEAVNFVTSTFDNGSSIMNGVEDSFNHAGFYTREQAIVTIYKIFRTN